MRIGQTVGDRFLLEELAASGGMGEVYKSADRETGQTVAVKVLLDRHADAAARFTREAHLLAEIEHPRIVGYIAHGVTHEGEPWLCMQWLEGEDLAARLDRGRLGVAESVALAIGIAEGLAAAHARGVVHRDLKPGNIFLVDGEIEKVRLLDFGIAQLGGGTRMTHTGMLLGTPRYMAPEQARSAAVLDARADVYSLGCVLFECLTGEPVFSGAHVMALLAKTLFDDPPRARDRLPGLPDALDALVDRMLSKEPERRPEDGRAVVAALQALGEMPARVGQAPPEASRPVPSLTDGEQRSVAVLLIRTPKSGEMIDATASDTIDLAADQELRHAAAQFGGHCERLLDGSVAVVMIATTTLATDLAAQAARCALSLRGLAAGRTLALAMGRWNVTGKRAMGHAIDRAARLLDGTPSAGAASGAGPVLLDEVTAGLLDARFDVREREAVFFLEGERELAEGTRTLLGKATPCVGRERELRQLEQSFDDCAAESSAQTALVTAQAGVGKSRLGQEFVRYVRNRHEAAAVWIGRGDALRAGSALGLLGQALRGACGVRDGEPLEARRDKVRARVAAWVDGSQQKRVTEFLGEIIGTPFPDDDSPQLEAARRDAQVMNDQMQAAFVDFLRAACARGPVVILLEDLHWGDRPTVQFLDRALAQLDERPLFVLALARPEVQDRFPRLWAERRSQEMRLKELPKKAIERLARHVLGDEAGPETMARLARLSEGNAFYLEELIRWAAEGRAGDLPETVVAMAQSRLGSLDDESRRLLRAAAVFGEIFWAGAVASLLGGQRAGSERDRLAQLVSRELLVKRMDSRFPGEDEYAFRHALLREAAYGMLTDDDRKLGHGLAADWLERAMEVQTVTSTEQFVVIAEHWVRSEAWSRAADYLERAGDAASKLFANVEACTHYQQAIQCLERLPETDETRLHRIRLLLRYNDLAFLSELPEKNIARLLDTERLAKAVEGQDMRPTLARVHGAIGRMYVVMGAMPNAVPPLLEALEEATELGLEQLAGQSLSHLGVARVTQGRLREARHHVTRSAPLLESQNDWTHWFISIGLEGMCLVGMGRYRDGLRQVSRGLERAAAFDNPAKLVCLAHVYVLYANLFAGDAHGMLEAARVAIEAGEQSGDAILVWGCHWIAAYAKGLLGDHEGAARDAEQARIMLEAFGGRLFVAHWVTAANAVRVLLAGRYEEAIARAEEAIAATRAVDDWLFQAIAQRALGQARAALYPPQWDAAEACFSESERLLVASEALLELARTREAWGLMLRARGDHTRARAYLERALAQFEESELSRDAERVRALLA